MEGQFVSFPIIVRTKKYNLFESLILFFIPGIGLLLYLGIKFNSDISMFMAIGLIIGFIIISILKSFIKKFGEQGTILFCQDAVLIEGISFSPRKIYIKEIKELTFIDRGYDNQPVFKTIFNNDGLGNSIKLVTSHQKEKYDIYVSNDLKRSVLYRLLDFYSANNEIKIR